VIPQPTLPFDADRNIARALEEDIGSGDITTIATVPSGTMGHARLTAKGDGVLAGLPVVQRVYAQLAGDVEVRPKSRDGDPMRTGASITELIGPARALLTGERVALNFLQHLSGIATRTARFVQLVEGTGARIVDTRKTVPGMRSLAKYAVRCGGGRNHRVGLYDGVLIKDNHIQAAGGITAAVQRARAGAPHTLKVEVEVESLAQLDEALDAGAELVLLDNMDLPTLASAVARCRGRAISEASGGVSEATVRAIAETGVDLISIGALTHSVTALDISLDWLS
jgi:nicotinate-nucleotide pyrophosphorylase (carboxylating)